MTYPSSILTVHKNTQQKSIQRTVGRGDIVSRAHVKAGIRYLLVLWVLLSQASLVLAVPAATPLVQFNISRQSADDSLPAFGQQANITVVYPFEDAAKHYTNRLQGNFSLTEGIYILLKDSGLTAQFSADGHLIISSDGYGESMMNTKKNILASTIAFFVGSGAQTVVAQDQSNVSQQAGQDWLLEEVIVTATKRETSLQDTAMSISVMGGEEIDRRGLVNMRDYLTSVPGISMMDKGPGSNHIIIRGIGLNQREQAAVSTYFGEVPLTSPVGVGSSTDMKMVDLERVEVLKGPQGTLYGSGSIGGTVRNIPVKPKLDTFEGKLNVGYSAMSHSSDDSHKLEGILNVPLIEDTLALRAVAYRFDTGGYVDRISTPEIEAIASNVGTTVNTGKDLGAHTYTGGRASLLWQSSDQLSIQLTLASQELEEEESTNVSFGLDSDFSQLSLDSSAPLFGKDKFDLTNLVLNYDLNWASLGASYSHFEGSFETQFDLGVLNTFVAGGLANNQEDKEGDTVEIRLSSQLEGPLQFIAGLYYEEFELQDHFILEWYGSDEGLAGFFLPTNGAFGPNGLPLVGEDPAERDRTIEQKAVFGEVTYGLSSQWALTAGVRSFEFDRRDIVGESFVFTTKMPTDVSTSDSGTIFKTNLSYTPNDDSLIYLQWAEGFRIGRGQTLPPVAVCDIEDNNGNPGADGILDGTNAPLKDSVGSDSTSNLELGSKFSLMDNRLTLNTTVYRVDWEDIPLRVFGTCLLSIDTNAGKARSQGVELETRFIATPDLQLSFAVSYMDTEFLDNTLGMKGKRLPLSPRVNGTIGVDYNFELAGYHAFLRSDYSYVGSYASDPGDLGYRGSESYGKWNMRVGIDVSQWSFELYGDNLTNESAVTIAVAPDGGRTTTPRTLGIDVGYVF